MLSIYCCTFRRPEKVEEVLGCFLSQDYDGEMELVIVNDDVHQELVFDHPQVRILNIPIRIKDLGKKRNTAVMQCRGEYIMCADDDDLFGSDRVSRAMAGMKNGCWASDRFYMDSNPTCIAVKSMHWNFAFSKELLIRHGGYMTMTSCGSPEARFKRFLMTYMHNNGIEYDTGTPNFLYRRYIKSVAHYTNRPHYRKFERQEARTGRIELEPHHNPGLFDALANLNAEEKHLKDFWYSRI